MIHIICGYHSRNRRSPYCNWSGAAAPANAAARMDLLARFADHCVQSHNGRMQGVIVEKDKREEINGRAN